MAQPGCSKYTRGSCREERRFDDSNSRRCGIRRVGGPINSSPGESLKSRDHDKLCIIPDHGLNNGWGSELLPAIPGIGETFSIFQMMRLVFCFFRHRTGHRRHGNGGSIQGCSSTSSRHSGRFVEVSNERLYRTIPDPKLEETIQYVAHEVD